MSARSAVGRSSNEVEGGGASAAEADTAVRPRARLQAGSGGTPWQVS
ncbi:hypothetical protein HaLaN_08460 [Haematococcus lacustris]|uniref:Uncharacterized protein n=1 Tax=Haematococcus lacustris TaxID=44745 RepID=A0A699YT03_HAELA|nr:hypothetical protein HaLaN_08460 [Haematococcus lacustris]